MVLPAAYVVENVELGYAVTAYRAQGITTDTAHFLADASTTRENLYVALTRGRDTNTAYVAVDRPDDFHAGPHPAGNPDATARSVLYGVLQHAGAELSAHETITAEQEQWCSISQLAAEYETIAQAAQHDRWATLLHASGLTNPQVDEVLAADTFGALSAELRRAEANYHNLDTLLPRLIQARGLGDAGDTAAVLHERLTRVTVRHAGGHARKTSRLIVGLIPEATGTMNPDMRQSLTERRDLIEKRANARLQDALEDQEPWLLALGPIPADPRTAARWWQHARAVAAYRDRYTITTADPLGPVPDSTAQKIDAARAHTALRRAHDTATRPPGGDPQRTARSATTPPGL